MSYPIVRPAVPVCIHAFNDVAHGKLQVSGYRGRLRGILVELPTLIETYKAVDSDILFKSGALAACGAINLSHR